MPQDGSNNYQYPPGTPGIPDTTIESESYNTFLDDLVVNDLNIPRPIHRGGTGAQNAHDAMIALSGEIANQQVTNYDSHPFVAGSFWSATAATSAPNATARFSGICTVVNDGTGDMTLEASNPGAPTTKNRRRRKTAGVWQAWELLPGSSADLDAAYVNVTGDTMTGHLALPTGPAATNAVRKDYVDTADALKVAKTGDTMSGPLKVGLGTPVLNNIISATSAGAFTNIGVLNTLATPVEGLYFADNTQVVYGSFTNNDVNFRTNNTARLSISAAGAVSVTGDLAIIKTNPGFSLKGAASGNSMAIASSIGNNLRWVMFMGDGAAEVGGDAGSYFALGGCNDAGSYLGSSIRIYRNGVGAMSFGRPAAGAVFTNTQVSLLVGSSPHIGTTYRNYSGPDGYYAQFFENSAGTMVGNINIAAGSTSFATTSDGRLKNNAKPFSRGREIIERLPIQEFDWKAGGRGIGVIAQDVHEIYPDAVVPGRGDPGMKWKLGDGDKNWFVPWSVDYSKYVPVLIQTLQDALKRIDALEEKEMNRDDARAFILALNAIQQYVPPILFVQVISNPVLKTVEQAANSVPENVEQLRKSGGDV